MNDPGCLSADARSIFRTVRRTGMTMIAASTTSSSTFRAVYSTGTGGGAASTKRCATRRHEPERPEPHFSQVSRLVRRSWGCEAQCSFGSRC
jgi:hypothetical protein